MKVHFDNNTSLEISEDIANTLKERILEGCNNFQIFTDKEGKIITIINITKITYII